MNECTKLTLFYFDFKRMHKTLFSLFYISIRMYFQNSSYVTECSMDAFEMYDAYANV